MNFSIYEKIDIANVGVSTNSEYTLEFWSYVYSFIPGNFSNLEVSWNQHAKIVLINVSGQLISRCYPFNELDALIPYTFYYEDPIQEGKWFFIRCAVNLFTNKHYINKNTEKVIGSSFPSYVKVNPTKLRIYDAVTTLNYGLSLIRDIRLWSSYNFSFWDSSRL